MSYAKLIIFTAICASTTVHASSVNCPITVKAGQSLIISAEFTNSDCQNDVIIKSTVLSLLGNSGSAIGLQGPFVTPLNSIIPRATCNPGQYTEGTQTLQNLVVIKKVPTSMKGKLAVASAGVLDDKNGLITAGNCLVTIN